MKTSYKYLAIAFATLLCSCNEEITLDVIESQVQISANITPRVLTRVTEDGKYFTDGDAIKVQNMDRENKNLATYTYSESTGKWATTDELYWDGETANTFNAWYPATAAYGSFTIPVDQTSGTTAADWMTATTSAKKANGTVKLSFNHNLAKVTVTIDSWSNEYSANEKVANALELNSLSSVMSYDGTLSGDKEAKWVKAYVAQENTSFVAIIAPATYASGDDIMQIYVNDSSTPLAVKTSSDLTIEAGKAYSFKLAVGKNLAEITSSVTIGEWDDEELEDQLAGVVAKKYEYIDEDGNNYGEGVEIDGVVWAPVNCGYHTSDYPYGKLYQWGRKYGQGYDSADAEYPSGDNIILGPVTNDVGQAEANKRIFYYSSAQPYDWATTQNDNLWNSGSESTPIKTDYDPCPSGWRVPTQSELLELSKNKSEWTTNTNNQNGFWFSGSKTYSTIVPQVFLPAAGTRGFDDGIKYQRDNAGNYWSSSTINHLAYDLGFGSGYGSPYSTIGKHSRSGGYSIRCVHE